MKALKFDIKLQRNKDHNKRNLVNDTYKINPQGKINTNQQTIIIRKSINMTQELKHTTKRGD